jgi:CAI-1 autoinducer synthase
MDTGKSTSQDLFVPPWLKSDVDDFYKLYEQARPYPFQHPEDLDGYICLHQNDYLRLSRRLEVRKAKADSVRRDGNAFLASSVFSGGRGMEEHLAFRELLAESAQAEDVILASSGWSANVGLVDVLAKRGTPVYLDQHAHASLWDGARMSQGKPIMVRHNDPEYLERRIRRDGAGVVCIESFYSLHGSVSDVRAYVEICERTGCVLVLDEAHSLGMVGPMGGGLAVQEGIAERVHFRTASFSKAIGGHGGCIMASRHLIWFLTHRASSLVFSSAALPCDSAAHRAALTIARAEPWLGRRALDAAQALRKEFQARGIDTGTSRCQVVSIEAGDEVEACRLYGLLRDRGVLTSVFLPPSSPAGAGVVRFSLHSEVDPDQVVLVADKVAEALGEMGALGRMSEKVGQAVA